MTIQEVTKWIHNPDGSLIPDKPFETAGTRVRMKVEDPELGGGFMDATGVITEETISRTKSRREKPDGKTRSRIYVDWTFKDGSAYGVDYTDERYLEVIE